MSQAKIENLHLTLGGEHTILRFQVAMNHLPVVRRRQAIGDGRGHFYRLAPGQTSPGAGVYMRSSLVTAR